MKYVPALDGLRGVAVLLVVLLHTHAPGFAGGHFGVDVFFVLSGYLITSILVAEHEAVGRISLTHFYTRRALRLYPALLLFLAVYLTLAPLAWPHYPHSRDALVAGFYLSDYAYAFWRIPVYIGHTWSLAAEEHFYLLWPPLLILMLRYGSRDSLPRKVGICLIAAWAWRAFTDLYLGQQVGYRFDTRAVGLMAGCWLAASAPRWQDSAPRGTGWAGAGLLALLTIWPKLAPVWLPLPEIAALGLIVGANALPLTNPRLVWLGKLSYGVYLWHLPIALVLGDSLDWWQSAPITLGLSIFAAWVSFNTVEALARRYRSRKLASVGWRSAPSVSQSQRLGSEL